MEFSTLFGLILGFVAMVGVLLFSGAGVSITRFIDPGALLMVFGGAAAVVLIGYPMKQLTNFFGIVKKSFFAKPESLVDLIEELVSLAETARKDGMLALENRSREIRDPFITLGIQLSVDGTRADVVEAVMNNEIEALAARHREAKKIVELVGRCGPAFGMIATLLGLILMLGNLENPETVGPSMAIALIGTLYGAILANLICIPLGEKLGYLDHEEILAKRIIVKAILAIQNGDNPRIVRQKLDTFVPPKLREKPLAIAA